MLTGSARPYHRSSPCTALPEQRRRHRLTLPLHPRGSHLPETTAGLRRRISDLQGDPELGCPICELEALQWLLWYREGEVMTESGQE